MRSILALLVFFAAAVAVANALPQRGACCSTKSATNCIEAQTIGDCVSKFAGVYLGDNKKCTESSCDSLPGACHSQAKKSCRDNVQLKHCNDTFAGFGSKCSDEPKPQAAAKGVSVSAEAKFEIAGRVRDSKTRRPIAHAVVAVLDKNHVRVATAKANAKGEYKVEVHDASKAPFTVMLSEKQTRDAKQKRCARVASHQSAVTAKEVRSAHAHKKHIVRDLVAQCGGGSSAASNAAKLQTVMHKLDITPNGLQAVRNNHLLGHGDDDDDDSGSDSPTEVDSGNQNDDDDDSASEELSSFTTSDSPDDEDDDDDGHHHHHHGGHDYVVVGIIIAVIAVCCLIWACFYVMNNAEGAMGSQAQMTAAGSAGQHFGVSGAARPVFAASLSRRQRK